MGTRIALNSYLLGLDRSSFEFQQVSRLTPPRGAISGGHGHETQRNAPRRIVARMAFFDAVTADPSEFFERYRLRYVALPVTELPPAYLNSGWKRLQGGPFWNIWERRCSS